MQVSQHVTQDVNTHVTLHVNMIEKLDDGNYEKFLLEANCYGGERVKTAVTDFLSQNLAVLKEHLTQYANWF